jgi:hypothetical protein
MHETRRRFLTTVAVCGSGLAAAGKLAAGNGWLAAQQDDRPRGLPHPPAPADPQAQDKNAPQGPDPQAVRKVLLARSEKEFREGVERLYQLSGELRDEVQKTPNTDVFSVRMYKKMEEIEKLAKQLKGKAKG